MIKLYLDLCLFLPCFDSNLANIKAMAPRPQPQRNRVLCELQRLKLLRREAQGSEAGVARISRVKYAAR